MFRWTRPVWMDLEMFTACQDTLHKAVASQFDHFIYQLESVPWDEESKRTDGKNDHYQGYGHLARKKKRPEHIGSLLHQAMSVLDLPAIDASGDRKIGKVQCSASSTAGAQALKAYAMKPESRIGGPWFDQSHHDKEQLKKDADLPELRMWQITLLKLLQEPPGDRKVFIVVDPSGNTGKTRFARYLQYYHNAFVLTAGPARDLQHVVAENPNHPIYVLNITKSLPSGFVEADCLHVLESIKDGIFTTTKYQSRTVNMKSPHVVLFTNKVVAPTKLSADRTDGCYYGIEDQVLVPRDREWVESHYNRQGLKSKLLKIKRKREQDEFNELLKKAKKDGLTGNSDFDELFAEVLGRPPPKPTRSFSSPARLNLEKVPEAPAKAGKDSKEPLRPAGSSASSAPARDGKDSMDHKHSKKTAPVVSPPNSPASPAASPLSLMPPPPPRPPKRLTEYVDLEADDIETTPEVSCDDNVEDRLEAEGIDDDEYEIISPYSRRMAEATMQRPRKF